jgi:hypothetical protein
LGAIQVGHLAYPARMNLVDADDPASAISEPERIDISGDDVLAAFVDRDRRARWDRLLLRWRLKRKVDHSQTLLLWSNNMITYHDPIEVVAGMPLAIAGTLLDRAGNLFDATNAQLVWCLLDPDGNPALTGANVQISTPDPVNGGIQISVPAQCMALPVGRYTDALQVVAGTSTDVFWVGNILIAANPFVAT